MHPDADPQPVDIGSEVVGRHRRVHLSRPGDRRRGPVEHDHEPIALALDLGPTVVPEGGPDQVVVGVEDLLAPGVTHPFGEARVALDVGERDGHPSLRRRLVGDVVAVGGGRRGHHVDGAAGVRPGQALERDLLREGLLHQAGRTDLPRRVQRGVQQASGLGPITVGVPVDQDPGQVVPGPGHPRRRTHGLVFVLGLTQPRDRTVEVTQEVVDEPQVAAPSPPVGDARNGRVRVGRGADQPLERARGPPVTDQHGGLRQDTQRVGAKHIFGNGVEVDDFQHLGGLVEPPDLGQQADQPTAPAHQGVGGRDRPACGFKESAESPLLPPRVVEADPSIGDHDVVAHPTACGQRGEEQGLGLLEPPVHRRGHRPVLIQRAVEAGGAQLLGDRGETIQRFLELVSTPVDEMSEEQRGHRRVQHLEVTGLLGQRHEALDEVEPLLPGQHRHPGGVHGPGADGGVT